MDDALLIAVQLGLPFWHLCGRLAMTDANVVHLNKVAPATRPFRR